MNAQVEPRLGATSRVIMRRILASALPIICIISVCSCGKEPPQPGRSAPASRPIEAPIAVQPTGKLIPAGDLRQDRIKFDFAIFYLPKPTKDPLAELDSLLKQKFAGIHRVKKLEGRESAPSLAATFVTDRKTFGPPLDVEGLKHFGRGLTQSQAEAVQKTSAVLLAHFAYSQEHVWDGLRLATELVAALAKSTGGLVWDETTRELFSPEAWQKQRIADWTENIPDISKHMTIHAYSSGDLVRAITLGMEKFALPDVVIENFPWSNSSQMAQIANLFLQTVAEGAVVKQTGQFDLNFRAIKNAKVRDPLIKTLKPNAKAVALLALKEGKREQGDPQNRLVEITFDRGTGPDVTAKQKQILAAAFGWEESTKRVGHNKELEAASERARRQLPALRLAFSKGLPPGETVLLKAPFATPGGQTEWMWVEVVSWRSDKIKGLLSNNPENIPALRAGQTVEVSEEQVFDYIRQHADGTAEGNETGKILERLSR